MATDLDTFRLLVETSHVELRSYCASFGLRGTDIDDVTQEAYLDYLRHPGRRPPEVPEIAWLKGILRLQCLTALRRRGAPCELIESIAAATRVPEAADPADHGHLEALRDCLQALNDRQRELLRSFYAGNSVAVLAQHLSRSEPALRQMLHRLRERLRDCVLRRQAPGTVS